ncbi:MAG: hypothetical protein PHI36_01055 [Bacteroidales bacterium]|nr:hypothetical protein [Bacteroidales bacterium]
MKKTFYFLLISFLALSCVKNNDIVLSKFDRHLMSISISSDSLYGVIHNSCLESITFHEDFPLIDSNNSREYLAQFMQDQYNITVNQYFSLFNDTISSFKEMGIEMYNNNLVSVYFIDFYDTLDSIKDNSKDLVDFDNDIVFLLNSIYSEIQLNDFEKHLLSTSILLYRSSAVYWYLEASNSHSLWCIYADNFPKFKDYLYSKRAFSVSQIALADAKQFVSSYQYHFQEAGCDPLKYSDCYIHCSEVSAYESAIASIRALF